MLQDIVGLYHSERFQEINKEIIRERINGTDGKSKFECLNVASPEPSRRLLTLKGRWLSEPVFQFIQINWTKVEENLR